MASLAAYLGELTGEVDTVGNITQFTYHLVPEPAPGALLLGGLGALVALRLWAIRERARASRTSSR
jgi:hypothetical protein